MGLSFPADASPASGFRPGCRVAPAATGGGLGGGLLDAAASLLGAPQADPWAEHLRAVELVQAPAPAVDHCRLELSRGAGMPELALGDPLTVELGYDDQLAPLFTGTLTHLAGDPERVVATLAAPALALVRLRENASYEARSFGDLVREWAAAAAVTTGTVEGGASYPFLAVDDRRSAWAWMAELARQSGLWAWFDGDGALQCKRPGGPPARSYRYGEEVLALHTSAREPLLGEVNLSGEGAAGSQGSTAWSWLAKKADGITATAGDGAPKRLWQAGALRNQEALRSAAGAVGDAAARLARTVTLTVPGSPELTVGAVFALSGCPDGDGDYAVLRVCHRYDKRHGYRTEVTGGAL